MMTAWSAAAARYRTIEINCRPERQDPPDEALLLAAGTGCVFAIDSDVHAPGQLDWPEGGCGRAEQFGINKLLATARSGSTSCTRAWRQG
jgi:histidinol phosphatase-like PHP family hydrolase